MLTAQMDGVHVQCTGIILPQFTQSATFVHMLAKRRALVV